MHAHTIYSTLVRLLEASGLDAHLWASGTRSSRCRTVSAHRREETSRTHHPSPVNVPTAAPQGVRGGWWWCCWLQAHIQETELEAWLAGEASPETCSTSTSSSFGPDQQQQRQLADMPSYRKLVLFSLNDYLGLSTHPDVRAAAAAAAEQVRLCA
jgi:hypothetical protein